MNSGGEAKVKQKNESGQSIVEISLITPLILIALYIPVDFGVSFFVANLTQTAAREGARIGSGLQKSGPSTNLVFSSGKNRGNEPITALFNQQDRDRDILQRHGLYGISRGDGARSI
jgi:hypothetical protein